MERKRARRMNIALIAAVLVLALAAYVLSRILPSPDITPTAIPGESSGITLTLMDAGQ